MSADAGYGCLYGPGGPMHPSQLTDGDRQAVADFRRYLAGELAMTADGSYVPLDHPDAAHTAPPREPSTEETPDA